MSENDLPTFLQLLKSRVRDDEFRSEALMQLMRKRDCWPKYTVAQWLSYCTSAAFRARLRHRTRVAQWGYQSTRANAKVLARPNVYLTARQRVTLTPGDTLTPLRRVELKEELGAL